MTLNCTKVLQSKHRYIEIIRIENEVEMWIEWEIRCKTNKMANCGHVTGCWTTLDSKSLYSNTFYIWTRCYLLLLLLISFFFRLLFLFIRIFIVDYDAYSSSQIQLFSLLAFWFNFVGFLFTWLCFAFKWNEKKHTQK